ncbi:MAG: VIT domain-containing protein [Campylobacterota bacterium]|nr:VIT domain-containing protein [Campylobacterota bacterium]
MARLKYIFIFLLFSSLLFALDIPSLKLHDSKLKPVTLSTMKVESQVIANIATSTYELSFYNPNAQIIEGELNFALLDGSSVIDYALEIKGKYREASIVPKAKAKEAFEDVVRQNIDPALIEKSIGNNFKTRLYPIPAKGYKKIKITIQERLPSKEGKSHYTMPFVSAHQLDHFTLNINVEALSEQSPVEIEGIAFDQGSQGKSFRFEKSNFKIKEPISIAFENPKEITTFSQKIKNTHFYMTTLPFNFTPKPKTMPNKVAILYNTSFSNKDREIDKELAFLKEYLFSIKNRKVEVIFFSNEITTRKTIDINNQGFKALAKVLRGATYDGTNNFAKLNLSKIKADEILLFSNGIKTLYGGNIQKINKPIIAINASLKADTGVLRKYAKLSHGSFIDLMTIKTNEAIAKLQNTQPIITISKSKGMLKGESFVEYANNQITLLTRSISINAKLTLTINDGNQSIQKHITFKDALPVDAHLPTLWASKRIEELSFEYDRNRQYIDKLAKYYKVLTKDMSMIVLDRVQDYVKHEITPPKELRKEYKKILAKKKNTKLYEKEQALIESIELIEEQKKWYAKKFPKTKRPEEKLDDESQRDLSDEEEGVGGDIMPVVMPEAAPRSERRSVPKTKKASSTKPKPQPKKLEIALKSFDPDTVYLKKLKELKKHQWLHAYEMMKGEYMTQPMYYVDVASFLYKKKLKRNAIRVLSNVLELDFDNSEFLRIFAYKAMEMKQYNLAIKAYERVANLRPFEPQSYRDLALAYAKAKKYRKAVKNLYHILIHTWDGRFNGIKIVVINEMNAILSKHKVSTKGIDKRLIAKMPVDLRVVINWSGNNSDMDLWVTDPHGEKTYYSNKLSYIGGKISNDITGGYGPEEFMIKDAVHGKYKIEVNYYGNSQQKTTIPVTIRAEVYTHYGKKAQKGNDIVVRVGNKSRVVEIGEVKY